MSDPTRTRGTKGTILLLVAALALAVTGAASASTGETCADLNMVWHDPDSGAVLRSEPYACGSDLCGGYRCKEGNEISPACYDTSQCAAACAGECVYIPEAQLDCNSLCRSAGCGIEMTWYQRKRLVRSEPYECEVDACAGFRCLNDYEISPACYTASQCAKSCRTGACVDIPALQQGDCDADLCSMN